MNLCKFFEQGRNLQALAYENSLYQTEIFNEVQRNLQSGLVIRPRKTCSCQVPDNFIFQWQNGIFICHQTISFFYYQVSIKSEKRISFWIFNKACKGSNFFTFLKRE